MKKKNILFATCLLGAFAFSSCEKNLYDESKQSEKEIKMTDLEIPANFPWETSKDAKCKIVSSTTSLVSIFLDSNCTQLLSTVNIDPAAPALPVVVPDYLEKAYLKYETVSAGNKVIETEVTNGMINFSLPEDAKPSVAPVVTRGGGKGDYTPQPGMEDNILEYPSGYGTVMFEDMYPQLGDYDFNDFVVNYKVQFQGIKKVDKKYTAQYIQIGLRLKAIGGIFPYSPYLRLKEIDSDEVESIEVYETKNVIPAIDGVDLVPNKHLIIDYSPLIKNLAKPAGSQYYNTEKNALVATSDLPEINILITLKKRKEVKEILEGDEFDLYLKRNDSGTEIHMNGIEPITYQYPFNDKNLLPVYTNGDEEDDNYYFSAGRLIWGLRVPGNAAHAIEKANFLEAYKGFAKWAQSSGKNEQNWYNQGNADKNLLIHN